jgi:hypothetical protein
MDRIAAHEATGKRYDALLNGLLLCVLVFFLWIRPLSSPWHPFIAGDGLGYYSYLPATFIYDDNDYSFAWFNKAHNANYVYSTFENPEDNLLVQHGDRKINKYYQGLSFIWLPFFLLAHAIASLTSYAADGYSAPYQWCIGFASLFYLFIALIYLRKLLYRVFGNDLAAILTTGAVFFGTHLCTYSVFANSHSHAYSFTFLTLFFYALLRINEAGEYRLRYFLAAVLFYLVGICIRPLNAVAILVVPAFIGRFTFGKISEIKKGAIETLLLLMCLAVLTWTVVINFRQTGQLFAYNYTDEKFDFSDPRFFDALFSYHQGLFVYVPLFFLALFGIPFLRARAKIILPLFFFAMIFLYSCWWYWPITKRAIVDFYAVPAIFLAGLISRCYPNKKLFAIITLLVLTCTLYFQFKSYQFRKGILDENATYGEIFWRHFFRTQKANIYPVPPHTILQNVEIDGNLENSFPGKLDKSQLYKGKSSLVLDPVNYICKVMEAPFPDVYEKEGYKKIRFSFQCLFEDGVGQTHVFMQFFDHTGTMIREVPFYLNKEDIFPGSWDRKEFGHELADNENLNSRSVKTIGFTIWNVEAKKRIWINAPKVEFILTDRSFETIR